MVGRYGDEDSENNNPLPQRTIHNPGGRLGPEHAILNGIGIWFGKAASRDQVASSLGETFVGR